MILSPLQPIAIKNSEFLSDASADLNLIMGSKELSSNHWQTNGLRQIWLRLQTNRLCVSATSVEHMQTAAGDKLCE